VARDDHADPQCGPKASAAVRPVAGVGTGR
jgi:hypothetical protein